MNPVHDSKEFFIKEKMVLIRPLAATDPHAGDQLKDVIEREHFDCVGEISIGTDRSLFDYCQAADKSSTVFIALSEDDSTDTVNQCTVGLAMYINNPTTLSHEMTLLIHPDFLDTRLSLELMDSLVADAAENGVRTLTTTDSNEDIHMRYLANKLGMSNRIATDDYKHTRYTLQVDKHPGTVIF